MRVLLVTSRFPLPPWRGNQMRSAEWLAALAGETRVLVAPEPQAPEHSGQLAGEGVSLVGFPLRWPGRAVGLAAALGSGRPLQEGLYDVAAARGAVSRALESHDPDVAVVQMLRCGWALEVIRRARPGLPVVFDAIDAMGLHFERSEGAFPAAMRPMVRLEARRCRRRERELVDQATITCAVSQRDLDALGVEGDRGRVVPVAGREPASREGGSDEPLVLLTGNLGYRPTVAGAEWFAEHVWPEVRRRCPAARWVLAGARPASRVRRLETLDGVDLEANVPDLAPFLARAAVALAPMAVGSGVPVKVLEAWAAGVPVVAHPWAAAGLAEDPAPGVAVASSPEEWIAAVVRLLENRAAGDELVRRGRAVWERHYRPAAVHDVIRAAVSAALEPRAEG